MAYVIHDSNGNNVMPVIKFACEALTVDDYNEIATVKKMGDLERKIYIRFMLRWKNGAECDGNYATVLAERIIDAIRNGYFGRFDRAWAFIVMDMILEEYSSIIKEAQQ